jgi:hypothetical protein
MKYNLFTYVLERLYWDCVALYVELHLNGHVVHFIESHHLSICVY